MAGYIRPDNDLFWIINGQPVLYMSNNSSKYSISYSDGNHVAQFGGNSTVPSRVSWLTVFDVELDDANNQYVCAINNTEHRANVTLEVQEASSKFSHYLILVLASLTKPAIESVYNIISHCWYYIVSAPSLTKPMANY